MEQLDKIFIQSINLLHDKFLSWRKLSYVLDLEISTIYKWRIKTNSPNILTKIGMIAFAEANDCLSEGTLKEILNEMDSKHSKRANSN